MGRSVPYSSKEARRRKSLTATHLNVSEDLLCHYYTIVFALAILITIAPLLLS